MADERGAVDLSTFDTFQKVHLRADTDRGPLAIHHTLGNQPNQAATGDHGHTALAAGGYGTPGTSAIGDVPVEGSATSVARADHRHGMPNFANPIALAFGDTIDQGVSANLPRADHRHAMPAAPSIPGGSGTVVSETTFGQAASAGAATAYSKGDHTHGTPTAPTIPTASASVVSETTAGQATAVGAATTFSKGDHSHGSPAGSAYGIYSGTGTPEGAVTAPVGSLFRRTDGGAGTTLYVKESGAGNTGWVGK
jgi:hypothetical protein